MKVNYNKLQREYEQRLNNQKRNDFHKIVLRKTPDDILAHADIVLGNRGKKYYSKMGKMSYK